MQTRDLASRLRQFDAYPKTLEDFRVKTFGGAAVTVVSGLLMIILFISELNYYLTTDIHPELFVDTGRGQKLRINLDITFPVVGCSFLSIDAMDVSGEQQMNVDHHILKERLNKDGRPINDVQAEKEKLGDNSKDIVEKIKKPLAADRCESCYGAETTTRLCCNSCEDVREAYRQKGWAFSTADSVEQCIREGYSAQLTAQDGEGCRIYGFLEVNKVAGNFHIAPGKSFQQHHLHVHDLQQFGDRKFNLTHHVTSLSFGKDYPGQSNPLDNSRETADGTSIMFQYFVKVVPTTYVKTNGKVLYTNQFSVTKHQRKLVMGFLGEQGLPGVFFMYELSPMMVKYTEKNRSFMHFLTGVCAIIGGIFTVAGMIDSFIYHSAKAIQKKIDLGKAT